MLIICTLLVSTLCLTFADAGKLKFNDSTNIWFERYTLQRPTIQNYVAYDCRVNNKLFATKLPQYGSFGLLFQWS